DTPRGLLRFTPGGSITRFETGVDFTDVAGGLDGKLYGYSASLKRVFVYDPNTLQPIRNFALPATIAGQPADYRGIALNAGGVLSAVTTSNYLCRFSSSGSLSPSRASRRSSRSAPPTRAGWTPPGSWTTPSTSATGCSGRCTASPSASGDQ